LLESITISYFSRLSIKHSLKPVMEDKDEGWKFQIMGRVLKEHPHVQAPEQGQEG
jgi:hypothetical protein